MQRPTAFVVLRVSGEFSRLMLDAQWDTFVLGRDTTCELTVASPGLSRRHLEFHRSDAGLRVRDLGSSNGTMHNGTPLRAGDSHAFAQGDVLLCGDVLLAIPSGSTVSNTPQDLEAPPVAEMYAPSLPHLADFLVQVLPPEFRLGLAQGGRFRFVGDGNLEELQARLNAVSRSVECLGHSALWQLGAREDTAPPRRASRTMITVPPSALGSVPQSAAMAELQRLIALVAPTDMNVLILGETGTGKEVMSKRVHDASKRARAPFVALNCAALSEQLFESEIFGHEKGAFTGAHASKVGLIESAADGTLFLDEVGELPLGAQAKLLRVLEQRSYMRVGSTQLRPMHARIIAATNRNLQAEMATGSFRSDLYFRLNGMTLHIPPLRDRSAQEIAGLMLGFLAEAAARMGKGTPFLSEDASDLLLAYRWPGNVRELRALAERAMLLTAGMTIEADILRPMLATPRMSEHTLVLTPEASQHMRASVDAFDATATPPPAAAVGDWSPSELLERQKIKDALERTLHNQTAAASELGLTRRALIGRLEKYDLPRPRKGT